MMIDPFHELRLEAEYSKQLKRLIDEYDALLELAEAAEFASDPEHYNEVLFGVYRLEPEDIAELKKAYANLPEYLKRKRAA